MIYLIGGPVRVGKSRLARMVVERRRMAAVSTDALVFMIGRNIPETRLAGKHIPQAEWEVNFYPFLRKFVKNILVDFEDYVIEGAVVSPALAARLADKFPIKAVFLGNSSADLDSLMAYMGNNRWLRHAPAGELVNIPMGIRRRSLEIEADCQRFDYPFVDLAEDFDGGMKRAFNVLLNKVSPAVRWPREL